MADFEFKCDPDGIGYVNKEEINERLHAICQCGNDTFRVAYGPWYCGGICIVCGNESELYSG